MTNGTMILSGRQVRNSWLRYVGRQRLRVPRSGAGSSAWMASHPPLLLEQFVPWNGSSFHFSTAASPGEKKNVPQPQRAGESSAVAANTNSADVAPSSSSNANNNLARNLAELSKARLSALVVSTTAFGFLSAGPSALAVASVPTFVAASLGTALCASSAATFNQIFEVERDRQMKRTKNRPLVTGAVSKDFAVGVGCLTGASGGMLLGLGTDPVTTMLGLGNIGLYAGLYTYMKPRSEANTWVGAVVGAVPPVMGWTAATGGSLFDAEAIMLGSTLFLWQFPHFFALNWMYRKDYERGGFSMVAVNDPHGDRTAGLIKRYGVYLASLPFISTALEVTSPMFAVDGGILLNGYALYVASKFDKERSNANARKVFLTSLWYLPCVMMLFLLHSRRWHEEVTEDDKLVLKNGEGVEDASSLLVSMQKFMSEVQSKGRDLCMHESIASKEVGVWVGSEANKTPIDGSKCPISLGKAMAESANSTISTTETIELKQEISDENSNTSDTYNESP